MSLCHECGEKVANIDIYCPYCGISLKSSEADAGVDESLESTIVVGRPDLPQISRRDSQVDDGAATPILAAIDEPVEAVVAAESAEAIAEPATAEEEPGEFAAPDGSAEAMTEPPAASDGRTFEVGVADESGPKTVSDESRETIEEEPDEATEPDIVGLDTEFAEPAAATDIRDLLDSNERAVEDPNADVGFESDGVWDGVDMTKPVATPVEEMPGSAALGFDAAAANGGLPDDSGFAALEQPSSNDSITEPEPGPVESESRESGIEAKEGLDEIAAAEDGTVFSVEPADVPSEVLPVFADDAGGLEASGAPDLAPADPVGTEDAGNSIAKPETELESKNGVPGASEFDSVRIIESPIVKIDEPGSGTAPQLTTVEDEEDRASASGAEPAAGIVDAGNEGRPSRSYTTPNIGVGDTDGKKSKLKPLGEGTVLNGRYEIVRKIGGGGMGAVYLASDKNLGGVLRAVKEMVQSYIEEQQQEKAVSDFKRESLLLTTLEHAAIPTIYDYFYDEKEARFYLVMKYINGGDLASRLRSAPEGRIDEKTVVEWGVQMADVLDYLHKRQPPIVYRDLKPANIMIDGNTGRAMLIDFGIARWINKEEKGVTAVGTMGYAPPELFSGKVEPRSDIYSLGSTMFHLLTGADPQSNPLLIFDFQKHPRPRQINPELSDQIERILMQAVEYNASKRISSAAETRKVLEEHLHNLLANRVTFGVKEAPTIIGLSDENVFCGFCGQNIVASDMFCAFCGAKQPIAQKGVNREIYASPRLTARLMVIGTNDLESPVFAIEKDDNLVGRRDPMSNIFPEVDLSKFDPQTKISRRHARIWRDGGNFMVEDLGSSNGTILMPLTFESFRLTPNQPHVLTSGDKLKLGDTTLHFVLG